MDYITNENRDQFEKLVNEIMTEQKAAGIAVAIVDRQGKIQYERYFGYRDAEKKLPIDRDTVFGLASVTKSFTSLSIMQMARDGILNINDPISKYIPEFTNKNQSEPVRIWHLMCHSGGFFPLPRIVVDQVAKEMGLDEAVVGDLAFHDGFASEGVKRVASRLDNQTNLIGRPGELLSYCNDGFGLLSDIIRRYGGCPSFADYLNEHILKPLGMTRSYCDFVKPSKDPNAAILYSVENGVRIPSRDYHNDAFVLNGGGCMKSTMSDMLKYICMYLNEGKSLKGVRIADEYSIREMCKPRQYFSPSAYYGYGLEVKSLDGLPVLEHGGSLPGVSSNLSWSYEADAGVMVLCNTMDVSAGVIADAAMRMYTGTNPATPRKQYHAVSWEKDFITQISGDYISGEGDRFSLYLKENGGLGMTLNGNEKEPQPVSPYMALVRGKFSDIFLQIQHDEARGVWGARYGSRIFPKC